MTAGPGRINVAALYSALAVAKDDKSKSWRQVAKELDLSPSTFTRMANGHRPDVEAFAALVRWLGQPADAFILRVDGDAPEPDLVASLAPLLRARKDLSSEDAEHLQSLFQAAVEEFQATRSAR